MSSAVDRDSTVEDLDRDQESPALLDKAVGTELERSGGARPEFALVLIIGGVLGTLAAAMLTIEYIRTLQDPTYAPACDINPFLTCGPFMGSEQGAAFGFPNPIIGLAAFPVVVTTGVLLLAGVRLPRWYWRGLLAGVTFGIGFVIWLQYHSLVTLRAVCPWCALVWTIMIPVFLHTLIRSGQNGALPMPAGLRSFLVPYRWALTVLWWLVVVGLVLFVLRDRWGLLL